MKLRTQALTALVALGVSGMAFGQARVTVAHFAPFADSLDATSVSVVLNGTTALEDVKFKDFTDYIELDAGDYTIDIVPTGAADPAITADFTLTDGMDYTVFATGNGSNQPLELMALADDNTMPAAGNVKLRVYHAAPFADTLEATEVSIRTAGGDIVGGLQGVPYGVGSDYLEVPAGTYDLKVASNDGLVNYIDPLPVDLPDGAIVTIFAVGDGGNQPLGLIAVPVGELPLRTPVDESASGIFQLLDDQGEVVPGHGFNFFSLAGQNRAVGDWLFYDEMGEPTWLTFDSGGGGFDGEITTATLYRTTEMGGPQTEDIGTITIGVESCQTLVAEVTMGDDAPVMYSGNRLTPTASCPF
ncbi:DUF4397 domain-containing protein [Marinihelvus fidelis]|nr:DUF4397 domain-containing protein [Marinihelvus fidelis]